MIERKYPDMWVDPEDDPRDVGVPLHGERETLLDYLRSYRLTIRMKCDGLDAEQMARRSVPPSNLSLLGLIRHLAKVEHSWFRRRLEGEEIPRLYQREGDRDHDFNGAVADDEVVAEAWEAWEREVAHAEEFVDNAESLDVITKQPGFEMELREVLVHLIEEYARHAGHADLIRESIDGRTGQ